MTLSYNKSVYYFAGLDESSYDIIYMDKHGEEALILGQVTLPDDKSKWHFVNHFFPIKAVYDVFVQMRKVSPNGGISLNSWLPGWNWDGKPFLKLRLCYGAAKPVHPRGTDWCSKCDTRGSFIRCALVCPDCGDILGGF